MKKLSVFLLALPLVSLLLAGCGKDEVVSTTTDPNDQLYGTAQTDQQFFELFAQNDDFFKNDDITMNDGETPQPLDDSGLGKVLTPVRPLRWARWIRNFTKQVTVDSVTADSLAYVTVTKTWDGVLLIAATYSDTSRVPDTLIRKPFTSQARKRIIFKRIANDRVVWRNWRPVAISLIDGGTTSSATIDITQLKLRFMREGVPDSIVVTDPTSTFLRVRRPQESPGKDVAEVDGGSRVTVQVTLVSVEPDTDHVALRFGWTREPLRRPRIRLHLVSESFDGAVYTRVYERSFFMHFYNGLFAAAVDAMTHSTLFDDTAPMATSFWGVPYRVVR